jgi:hypothetical protein
MTRIVTSSLDPDLTGPDPVGGMPMQESMETRRTLRRLIRTGDLESEAHDRVAWNMVSELHLNVHCTAP